MVDQKLTELPSIAAAESADLLYLVRDSDVSSRQLTVANLIKSLYPYAGSIAGAYGVTDPAFMLQLVQTGGTIAATPTNIGTSVARCSAFMLPHDLTVNTIRWYGVGSTSQYRVAIYRYSDGVRMTDQLSLTTASSTWGSVTVSGGVTLLRGVLYYIAVAVSSTGSTAGVACMGTTVAATTGQVATAPQDLPGNLDLDTGVNPGYLFQFAVTTGALPTPAPTLVAQSNWTGGMPAFWLDNA